MFNDLSSSLLEVLHRRQNNTNARFQTKTNETIPYSSGLRLSDKIAAHHSRLDSSLLNSRWLFETVRVDTTKKLFGQLHAIEGFNGFIPIGIEVGVGQPTRRGFSSFFTSCTILRRISFSVVKNKRNEELVYMRVLVLVCLLPPKEHDRHDP